MISIQPRFFDPIRPCTREEFFATCNSEKVKHSCRECARVCQEIKDEQECLIPSPEKIKALKAEYSRLKKSLPIFVFQATFPGQKRKQSDAKLNGLYMVDFDHVPDMDVWLTLYNEKTLPSLCEQYGILLVHITPSGQGLRMVAVADAARGNLADNQAWLANQLHLKHDEACKDASRSSFAVSEENILYINAKLFTYEDPEFDSRYGRLYRNGGSAPSCPVTPSPDSTAVHPVLDGEASQQLGIESAEKVAARRDGCGGQTGQPHDSMGGFRGHTFAEIIAEWWRQHGGQPVEGDRNVKLQKLASNLRYICDNKPENLLAVIPSYGLDKAEMEGLVKRACAYSFHNNIPAEMRKVLETLGSDIAETEKQPDGKNTQEVYADILRTAHTALKKMKLPPALQAVVGGVNPELRAGALLASLPMFYTLLSRVRFRHFDGQESRLSGMTFIVGPAASGKSFIRELDALLMDSIRAQDAGARQQEEEYRRQKELNKNKKEQAEKPTPCIRIVPSQVSNTKLAERMRNAYDPDARIHLHCYTVETELATAIRAAKGGSWIEKNDIYCKSFHNELWGMDYANDQAINGEIQVNLNLVISGTEDAFDKLIPTGTILSGLPTRIMYFPMAVERFKNLDLNRTRRTEEQQRILKEAGLQLSTAGGFVDATPMTNEMYRWCGEMADMARLEDDEELDDLRKRTALIGIRAGIVFAILQMQDDFMDGKRLKFTPASLRFARWVADFCLQTQYAKFAHRMREQKQRALEYSGTRERTGRNAQLYKSLPDRFDTANVIKADPGKTVSAAHKLCSRWCSLGLIKRLKHGVYEKKIHL